MFQISGKQPLGVIITIDPQSFRFGRVSKQAFGEADAPIDLQPIVPIAAADDTSTSTTTTSTDSTSGSVSLVGKSDDVGKDPRGVALARATELAKPNAPTMAQQQQAMWDLFELAFEKNYPVDTSKPATVTRNQQFMAALTKLRATSTDGYTHIMIPQSIDGISWSQILKGTINY